MRGRNESINENRTKIDTRFRGHNVQKWTLGLDLANAYYECYEFTSRGWPTRGRVLLFDASVHGQPPLADAIAPLPSKAVRCQS